MTVGIEIKGLGNLEKKINSLAQMKAVKAALQNAGTHVKGEMARYPQRKHITIQQVGGWASEKQRRWFFAALRSGEIDVPYRRGQSPGTEDLGQRWTVTTKDGGLTVVVGNNASYALYVQGDDKQSQMMKLIGWKTDKQVVEKEKDKMTGYLEKAIKKILDS